MQVWKGVQVRDVAKPLLAGLLPRGLATETEDEQRELELALRDLLCWAHQCQKSSNGPQIPQGTLSYRSLQNKKTKVSWVVKGTRDQGVRRAQTQPNQTELHREVFAFKSWKGYHYPSPASQKHNLGGISWVLPDEPTVCFSCLSDQYPCLNSAYRPNHPGESQPRCLLPPVNALSSISILLLGDWRAWIRPRFNIPGNKRASLVKKLDQVLPIDIMCLTFLISFII